MCKRSFIIAVLVAVLFVSGSVIGCAGPAVPTPEKPIIWRYHDITKAPPTTDAGAQEVTWFMNVIKERSNGRLVIEPYWTQILCPAGHEFRVIGEGEVEIGMAWWCYASAEVPWVGACDHCGPSKNLEEAFAVVDALEPLLQETGDKYGFDVLASFNNIGVRQGNGIWFWMNKDIKNIEDLEGILIRAYSSISSEAVLKPLGMKPVFMSIAEVSTALQTGVIDAAMGGVPFGIDYGLHTISKYCYAAVPASIAPNSIIVNKNAFDALPSDVQSIVREAAEELEQRAWKVVNNPKAYGYDEFADWEAKAQAGGCELRYFPQPVLDQIERNVIDHLLNVFEPATDEQGKQAVELLLAAIEEVRGGKIR